MVSTRASRSAAWSTPAFVPALSSIGTDSAAAATPDQRTIYLASDRGMTASRLYVSARPTNTATWSPPTEVTGLTSSKSASNPMMSRDELTMYYDLSTVVTPPTLPSPHLYVTHRATTADNWTAGTEITELNSATHDSDPWVSPDQRHIFFTSIRGSSTTDEIWESYR